MSSSELAPVAPVSSASELTASGDTSKTTSSCPSRIRRRTMLAPMRPSPTIPSCMPTPPKCLGCLASLLIASRRGATGTDELLDRPPARVPRTARELQVHGTRPRRAAVYEACVRLHQRRSGEHPLPDIVGGLHPADRDQHKPITDASSQAPQYLERPPLQRCPRH